MTTIIQKLKNGISELKKDIEYFLDIEKVDIDDIEPMRYPDSVEPTVNPPFVQHGHKDGSRLKYRR